MPASTPFPTCSLSQCLPEFLLLVFPSAGVVEEVLPRLGPIPRTPPAFLVILVVKPLQVDCIGSMPGLQLVDPDGQRCSACYVFISRLQSPAVPTKSLSIGMSFIDIINPEYLTVSLWNSHFSYPRYNSASSNSCIFHLTWPICFCWEQLWIRISSNYTDADLSKASLIALLIQPWRSAVAFVVPNWITVGSYITYLVWKVNLDSFPSLIQREL
jgi:hypothetical protein